MFIYFHCYMPQTWEAQVKKGLVNENAGIRFSQSIDIPEELKFNNLAKEDGALYSLVRELKCPFYIDRLQGGIYIEDYPYDMSLVKSYKDLIGENFWGYQMHEWMSNYRSDLKKLKINHCPQWTKETISETIQKAYPFPHIFLEAMNAQEYEETGCPVSLEEFVENSAKLFAKRQLYTDGLVLPCDSIYLAYPIELQMGAKRIMPEIGWMTPNTRVQVAYARGMAKATNIPFGTYYEPWGGQPFSACCYHREGKNEWNIGGNKDFPFETAGENGGSSRSMQKRMHLYSYMAGASFMSEEWGMCNTFYDWNDFELSPYGIVKHEFIRFTERYPNIGKPITPIAVVLPKDLPILELNEVSLPGEEPDPENIGKDSYLGYPISECYSKHLSIVRNGIHKLFCESGPMLGTETTSLLNCIIPDALDIVREDFLHADDYQYLVDLTDSEAFAKKYSHRICAVEDVKTLLEDCLPCIVKGNAMKQFTLKQDGTYYILLTNNSGVERTVINGEVLLDEATETVTVKMKDGKNLCALEGNSHIQRGDNNTYYIEIPAGGWFFGTIA